MRREAQRTEEETMKSKRRNITRTTIEEYKRGHARDRNKSKGEHDDTKKQEKRRRRKEEEEKKKKMRVILLTVYLNIGDLLHALKNTKHTYSLSFGSFIRVFFNFIAA